VSVPRRLDDLGHAELAVLVREYLLGGQLIDRAGIARGARDRARGEDDESGGIARPERSDPVARHSARLPVATRPRLVAGGEHAGRAVEQHDEVLRVAIAAERPGEYIAHRPRQCQ